MTGPASAAGAPGGSTARATLLVVVAACCFGSISTLALVATRGGTPLVSVLAVRYLLAAAMLVAAAGGPARAALPRRHALRALVLGGGGQAVVAFTSLASLRYVTAATLAFLFYTYPAWVTVIAAVRGHERLTLPRVVALALSLGGIVAMVGAPGSASLHPVGLALALGSALVYAVYVPFIDELQRGTTPAVTSVYICAGAGVVFAIGSAVTTGPALGAFGALGAAGLAATVTLALLCTAVAFLAFLGGLATLGPVRTAILSTVEPFWTALLGVVALGQPLTRGTMIGGAMIAAAVIVLQWPARRAAAA